MRRTRREALATASALLGALAGCSELDRALRGPSDVDLRPPDERRLPSPDTVDDEFDDDVRAMAREVGLAARESVVRVSNTVDRGRGTGWVLDDGYVVTNAHIAAGGIEHEVRTFDGETVPATRVGYTRDLDPDVALLEAPALDVAPLPTGTSSELEQGDPLVQVGHPAQVGAWILALGRFVDRLPAFDWLLSDIPTDRGNSGSPLVTLAGDVVGMTSGSTRTDDRRDYTRSERVFTEYPEQEELATANPVETVRDAAAGWR